MDGTPLFRRLLGTDIEHLPETVRRVHDGLGRLELSGLARVTTRPGWLPWLVCAIMGLPAPGQNVPVTVAFERAPGHERWERRFGRRRYASELRAGSGREAALLVERMGLLTNVFALEAASGRLHFRLLRCRFMGVALPRWLSPRCEAEEREEDGAFVFDVPIDLPLLGRLIRYTGRIG